MATALYGGTFDPIHLGHLIAAEAARDQLRLDRVVFVPAADPPHKRGRTLSPVADRIEMVRRAIAGNPGFCLSLADVERPGPHYTVDTVPIVRAEWQETGDLYLLLGADQVADLATWHQPELLLERCRIAAVARPEHAPDYAALARRLAGVRDRIVHVQMPLIGISATELRRRASGGASLRYQVPDAVEAFIREHRLYGSHPHLA